MAKIKIRPVAKATSPDRRISNESIFESTDPAIENPPAVAPVGTWAADQLVREFDLDVALDALPKKLFFKIGEVAELLEVKTSVLRYWEKEFTGLKPQKSESGQRVYRKKDVETLILIKHLLYTERFSLEGARKHLKQFRSRVQAQAQASQAVATEPSLPIKREMPEAVRTLLDRPLSHFFKWVV